MLNNHNRRLQVVLLLLLLAALFQLPAALAELRANWPIIRHWSDPDEQYRLLIGAELYDTLRAADKLLPAHAPVLLVTDGRDVRHAEYTAYHRALYFLAPRPVWWLSPAPSDNTWESRWWISAPLTADSVRAVAAEKGVACVLSLGETRGLGEAIATFPAGTLRQISGESGDCQRQQTVLLASQAESDEIWPLQLGLALLLILALGYFLVGISFYPAGRVESAALVWLLGAGVFSLLLFGLDRLHVSYFHQLAALSCLAGLGPLLGFARLSHPSSRQPRPLNAEEVASSDATPSAPIFPLSPRLLVPLSILILAFYLLYVILLTTGRPFTLWDSWVNWGMKARTIWLEEGITPAVYADPSRAVTLQDYPLFVPLVESWFFNWLNAADDRLAAIVFPLTYLALLVLLYSAGRRQSLPRYLALLVVIAAAQPLAGLFAGAYTDGILAAYAAVAAIYLLEWLNKGTAGALLIAAIAAGLLPWIKREGVLLLASLLAALLLVGILRPANPVGFLKPAGFLTLPNHRTRRALVALLAAAAVLAGPWLLFTAANGISNDAFLPLTPATLLANIGRLPVIAYYELKNLLHPRWLFLWPLLLLTLLTPLTPLYSSLLTPHVSRFTLHAPSSPLPAPHFTLLITPLLYITIMSFLYLFSAFVPYQQHIVSSDFRLVAQVLPLAVLWLVYHGRSA